MLADSQQLANGPATATRNAIADEVLHFAGANIHRDDQGALGADQATIVSLTINDMPTHLPHFGAFVRVPCAVALRILAGQAGRVLGQILHLAGLGVSGGQARVFLVPPLALLWRFSQDLGLANPCVEVRRNFTDEGLLPLVEPIEKLAIATVELIKRPCLHCDAVEDRLVDQHQGDLWLGQKLDFVRDMSFFRRSGSSAQSSGRYVRAAIKHWKVAVANDRATLTTAFSTLPRLPLYCRLTPTVSFPALAVPVSSITPIASGSACSATTSLRQRLSTSSWSQWIESRNRWSVRGATPCFKAIASTFLRPSSDSKPRTYAAKSLRPLTPWKQSAKRARNWASIFPSDAISWSDIEATFRGFVVKQFAHGGSFLFGSRVKRDNYRQGQHLRIQNATKWCCPVRYLMLRIQEPILTDDI